MITVVIPTHNRINLLKRAIESCLEQNFLNQILVSDDSAEFFSQELVQIYPKNVKIISRKNVKGLFENFFSLFPLAESEIVYPLSDDDILLPGALERVKSAFDKVPNASLYISNIIYAKQINCLNNGLVLGPPFLSINNSITCLDSVLFAFSCLFTSPVPIPGLAFKKNAVEGFFNQCPRTTLFAERCLQAFVALKDKFVIIDPFIGSVKYDHCDQESRKIIKEVTKDEVVLYTSYIKDLLGDKINNLDRKEIEQCYNMSKHWQGDFYLSILLETKNEWLKNKLPKIQKTNEKFYRRCFNKVKSLLTSWH